MSLTVASRTNPPVGGGKEEDLLFLISVLDKEDKVEFVKAFRLSFEKMVEEGELSKTAYYKFLNGYAPSDDRILEIVQENEKAKEWLIEKVKEKAKRALQIIAVMEAEEE